jgi:hypothetical protein
LRDEEKPIEVGRENVLPDGKREFPDREIGVGDAGVVDQNVKAPKLATSGVEEDIDRVGIADVAGMDERADFHARHFPAEAH